MTPSHGSDWRQCDPNPELLAAYLDGEFEGRDDLADLRLRLEDWITANPQIRAQILHQRRLRQLLARTTPGEPTAHQWHAVLAGILARTGEPLPAGPFPDPKSSVPPPAHPGPRPFGTRPFGTRPSWQGWAAAACCACLLAIPVFHWLQPPPAARVALSAVACQWPEDEPFPVAQSHEVVVVQVDGADTASLPIGQLPVSGELELAGHADIAIASPTRVVFGPRFPMIWARLDDTEP